jgi:hypothetical protein
MAKRLINKIAKKKFEKKCYFCEENNYSLLHVHRIVEGCVGGEYTESNTVVACANCHCKIHAGSIRIDRKYLSSTGKYILHYWINDEERWN